MKHTGIALALCAVAVFTGISAVTAGPLAASPTSSQLRIGTFDSRAVALAYWRGEEGTKYVDGLRAELKKAQAENDTERIEALEAEGPGLQARMHQQVFSTGTVRDVVQKIEGRIPAIAAEAGVSVVVSKWELVHVDDSAELVDVTSSLVALFDPSEEVLKTIEQMSHMDPVPIEELSTSHEH